MSDFKSPGQLTLESMPDAPDQEWLHKIVDGYNQTQQQLVSAFKRGLTSKQNTVDGEKSLDLQHGVEIPCSNPLDVPIRGVYPIRCDGLVLDSAGAPTRSVYPLDMPQISWRPNQNSDNGGILVKAKYQESIGERIGSIVLRASAVVISTAAAKDVTSITLTPGTWDLTGVIGFKGLTTATSILAEITTTSNAAPSSAIEGDNLFELGVASANDGYVAIPSYRVTVTTSTTYYLTAYAAFTASSSPGAYGRLSAIRAAIDPSVTGRVNLFFYGG